MLWTAYSIEGDLKRAERARSFASISYRIVVGEDETFEETYGGKARVLIAQKKLWKSVWVSSCKIDRCNLDLEQMTKSQK